MSNLANRTIKNSAYSFGGFLWLLGLSFFTLPIMIRNLGVEQYGIYVIIIVVMGMFALVDFGFSYLFGKRLSEDYTSKNVEKLSGLFSVTFLFYLTAGLLAGSIVALIGFFIPSFFHLSDSIGSSYWQLPFFAGATLCLQMMVMPLTQIPAAFQRFDLLTKISLVNITAVQLSMVCAVLLGFGIKTLFLIQFVSAFLLFICYIYIWQKIAPHLSFHRSNKYKEIFVDAFKSGIPYFFSNAMLNMLSQLDKYMVGVFVGTSAVSYYASAQMLPNKIQNVSLSLSPVFFPVFSNLDYKQEISRLADIFRRAIKFIMYITSGLVMVVLIYGWELLMYWLGPEFAFNASISIRLLAVCYFLLGIFSFIYYFLGGIKKSGFALFSVSLMAVIDIILMLILIPRFGINGASLAYLISVIPVIGYVCYIEKNIFRDSLRNIIKNYLSFSLKIILVNFGVSLVSLLFLSRFITSLWTTLFIGGITYVTFLVCYWCLGFVDKIDRDLIRNYFVSAVRT
jgi:O-antigen/teichoic acid export membrane protein